MANESKDAQGITAITVSGFKSLGDESRIEVRPLTILAGANSSGKSSIMQPLLLMKQTLEAPYDPGPLRLDGDHVKFTQVDQFLSRFQGETSALKAEIERDSKESVTNTFRKLSNNGGIELIETAYHVQAKNVWASLKPEMTHQEIVAQIPGSDREFYERLRQQTESQTKQELEWCVTRNRCFLYFDLQLKGRLGTLPFNPSIWSSSYEVYLSQIIHVPGLRGTRERLFPLTPSTGPSFEGIFDHYVGSVISYWSRSGPDSPLSKLVKALGPTLQLTNGIGTIQRDDTSMEIMVGRGYKGTSTPMVNIADVGFGVSQVLPVIVALLVAEPGQLVYIEQPELHLHPRAQVALAQVLADAANRGVRVVAETRSDLLLLGLQTLVAEGKLSPDIVKLHWFERDEDGVSHITSSDVEEDGAFENWPEDFSEVTLKAQSRYLDAAEAHHVGS